MAIKSIKLSSTARLLGIPVLAVICVAGAFVFAKWFFANTIASRSIYKEIAALSVGLAPADPQTHFSSAVLLERTFLPEDLPKSLAEYEQAAALSPDDYRLWLDLGKARERNGERDAAEAALRKAQALAPNYSQVQWTLGNLLLREGKSDEAFAEIRKAAEGDKNFANPAIADAWQLFQGDTAQIRKYAGDSANLKAALASALAKEKRFDESFEVWESLPEAARKNDFKSNGDDIYQKMIEAKKYRTALRIFSQIAESEEKKFALGTITNGGFEMDAPKNPGVFEWQIAEGVEPQIGVDNTQKHSGNISLKLIFNTSEGKAFRAITQSVAVEANKRYVFETFYKSELKTALTVKWEIIDVADGKILAATEPIAENTDWTALKTEFTAPEAAEAVTIRLVRVPCSTTLCPISGKLWFDDFNLNAP
jgi:tetratricopeptide (TPR) repeat protein